MRRTTPKDQGSRQPTALHDLINDDFGKTMPNYRCFGVNLSSTIPLALPETTGNHSADIVIAIAEPAVLEQKYSFLSLSQDYGFTEIILRAPGVAQFSIYKGSQVTVQPDIDCNTSLIPLYLVGSVLSLLLFQRGFLVLHGSAVSIRGQGGTFLGHSGAGKSSIAAACLQKKGTQLVADDAAVISFEKDGVKVLPGFPRLKIHNLTAAALDIPLNSLIGLEPAIDEESVLQLGGRFSSKAVPLKALYLLEIGGEKESFELVAPAKAFVMLLQHTIPSRYGENGGPRQFQQLANLLDRVPVFLFRRPKDLGRLPRASRNIAEHLASLS